MIPSAPIRTAHVDGFIRDRLPPAEQWPVLLLDRPEFRYPDRLNCVSELLDRWVEQGRGERPCLISANESLSYGELAERVSRIANILTQRFGLLPGNCVLLRAANNPMLVAVYLAVMKAGGLVPDETVNRMVEERIEEDDCKEGFILDGFPRTVNQAVLLNGLLAARHIYTVVVHLKVDYNVVISRIAGRRQCPTCGALYSVTSNAPTVSEVCDYDGSKLIVRDDDRPEVVEQRLKAYEGQTAPVLAYLKQAGYVIEDVQGEGASPQAIARRIEKAIQEVRV